MNEAINKYVERMVTCMVTLAPTGGRVSYREIVAQTSIGIGTVARMSSRYEWLVNSRLRLHGLRGWIVGDRSNVGWRLVPLDGNQQQQ